MKQAGWSGTRREPPDRPALLALAALARLVNELGADPLDRPLWLRALLAALFARSSGDPTPYIDFWLICHEPRHPAEAESADSYLRKSYARTHLNQIEHTITGNGPGIRFPADIARLIQDETTGEVLAREVRLGAARRDILASKGHPRSDAARCLMDEMLKRGTPLDGKPK